MIVLGFVGERESETQMETEKHTYVYIYYTNSGEIGKKLQKNGDLGLKTPKPSTGSCSMAFGV